MARLRGRSYSLALRIELREEDPHGWDQQALNLLRGTGEINFDPTDSTECLRAGESAVRRALRLINQHADPHRDFAAGRRKKNVSCLACVRQPVVVA